MATSAFGKAFAAARKAGDAEFTFNGKKYNTRMKGESAPQQEPPNPDIETGMSRGTRSYNAGAGRGYVNPELPKGSARATLDANAEAGMSRGTRTYKEDTADADRVKNLAKEFNVPMDRKDETGEAYKKGGSVRGWGQARGARKAKIY